MLPPGLPEVAYKRSKNFPNLLKKQPHLIIEGTIAGEPFRLSYIVWIMHDYFFSFKVYPIFDTYFSRRDYAGNWKHVRQNGHVYERSAMRTLLEGDKVAVSYQKTV